MKCPKRLTSDDAKAKWKAISPCFDLNSKLDVELLTQFCEVFAVYKRAESELAKSELISVAPNGARYGHPSVNIMKTMSDTMRRIYKAIERKRIEVKDVDNEEDEFNLGD